MTHQHNNRNSWKLCGSHRNCSRCVNTLESWKTKAYKHSATAQGLKFVIVSMMDERTEQYNINEMNVQAQVHYQEGDTTPIVVRGVTGGEKMPSKCGICLEHYEYEGEKNMCALNCSHTVCVSCVNGIVNSGQAKCPYCREDIKRVVNLHYDAPPPQTDDDDEDDTPIKMKKKKVKKTKMVVEEGSDSEDDTPIAF